MEVDPNMNWPSAAVAIVFILAVAAFFIFG